MKHENIILYLEPWAEELTIEPAVIVLLRQYTEDYGNAAIEYHDDGLVFFGNVQCKVEIEFNGSKVWQSYGYDPVD